MHGVPYYITGLYNGHKYPTQESLFRRVILWEEVPPAMVKEVKQLLSLFYKQRPTAYATTSLPPGQVKKFHEDGQSYYGILWRSPLVVTDAGYDALLEVVAFINDAAQSGVRVAS